MHSFIHPSIHPSTHPLPSRLYSVSQDPPINPSGNPAISPSIHFFSHYALLSTILYTLPKPKPACKPLYISFSINSEHFSSKHFYKPFAKNDFYKPFQIAETLSHTPSFNLLQISLTQGNIPSAWHTPFHKPLIKKLPQMFWWIQKHDHLASPEYWH